MTAAIIAGSVALLGFGLDSVIEGLASIIIVWRFTGTRTLSQTAERRAQKAVAVTFFRPPPTSPSTRSIRWSPPSTPETSWLGIGLSIASLIVMPLLGTAISASAPAWTPAPPSARGQNMLCAYLAVAVLAGPLANTWFGLRWANPVIALGIAALAVHEGREAWEDEEDD